ncbi:hypothetical protein FQA39_LY11464 [Lamprigera yunnana]|nr:hypothetical protein FQA39_LY11464 [Lamprigera yunnana]
MHINNPSATRIGIGKLNGYRLDFLRYSQRWRGCTASIVPQDGYGVWGALWEVNLKDLPNLDKQEGVHQQIYHRFLTRVEMPDGTLIECYTYEQVNKPTSSHKLSELPENRQPSRLYKETIVNGAEESKLPEEYQTLLQQIACNDFNEIVDLTVPE